MTLQWCLMRGAGAERKWISVQTSIQPRKSTGKQGKERQRKKADNIAQPPVGIKCQNESWQHQQMLSENRKTTQYTRSLTYTHSNLASLACQTWKPLSHPTIVVRSLETDLCVEPSIWSWNSRLSAFCLSLMAISLRRLLLDFFKDFVTFLLRRDFAGH